jgi:hypothetical protein
MDHDYFAILGLTPGVHRPEVIEQQFRARRQRLLASLAQGQAADHSHAALDALHRAYRTLADPDEQQRYLVAVTAHQPDHDPADQLRWAINGSLEGGLLRYSRRQELITLGQRLGFNEFQVQLMIAQVQFGDAIVDHQPTTPPNSSPRPTVRRQRRPWLAALAVFLLAAALFVGGLAALGLLA